MQWHGIMDSRLDPLCRKKLLQLVAPRATNDEQVEDVLLVGGNAVGGNPGSQDWGIFQGRGKLARMPAASRIPGTKMRQLDGQHRSLQGVQPRVVTHHGVEVLLRTPVVAEN